MAVQPPTTLADAASGTEQTVAEVALYGDVVMRFVSGSFQVRPTVWWSPVSYTHVRYQERLLQ